MNGLKRRKKQNNSDIVQRKGQKGNYETRTYRKS